MVFKISLVFAALVALSHAQYDPQWADGRSTIVHLFEWPFANIANECEAFLAEKGFAGVQVRFFLLQCQLFATFACDIIINVSQKGMKLFLVFGKLE